MDSNELQPGDLIFSFNSLHESEHLALYAGSKDGVPYVLHATAAPHDAVMLTYLTAPDMGCHYRVMRPINMELALDAKKVLLTWVEYLVPYASDKKRDEILNRIDFLGGLDNPTVSGPIQEEYGKKTYEKNYSQYLVMANHLPFIPVMYVEEGQIEGLRCAEAIVAAFNIALLMLHATERDGRWLIEDAASLDEFICALNNPLPFDSKEALSFGVYQHCLTRPRHWDNMGELTFLPYPEPDLKSKADWREFKASLKEVAQVNQSSFFLSSKGSSTNGELISSPIPFGKDKASSISSMRLRSISTSSIEPMEEGRSKSRLSDSPYYEMFFMDTPTSSPIKPLDVTPASALIESTSPLI